jgi:hypothetical protein
MKTCIALNEKNKYSVRTISECGMPAIEIKGGELPDVDKTFDCGQCF